MNDWMNEWMNNWMNDCNMWPGVWKPGISAQITQVQKIVLYLGCVCDKLL